MVSPKQLLARGVPVHRLVHEEGSFVITFPNAYHSGFNTGASTCDVSTRLPAREYPLEVHTELSVFCGTIGGYRVQKD